MQAKLCFPQIHILKLYHLVSQNATLVINRSHTEGTELQEAVKDAPSFSIQGNTTGYTHKGISREGQVGHSQAKGLASEETRQS